MKKNVSYSIGLSILLALCYFVSFSFQKVESVDRVFSHQLDTSKLHQDTIKRISPHALDSMRKVLDRKNKFSGKKITIDSVRSGFQKDSLAGLYKKITNNKL